MTDMLTTAKDVIKAIGGTAKAKALTGRTTRSAISNWRSAGKLPPDTFLVIQSELKQKGLTARASLWGLLEPEVAE